MRIQGLVLYPLLAATYPVLALAAANPGEIPGLWVLRWPVAISIFISAVTWLLLTLVVRQTDRRAFLTFMLVVLFASQGYFSLALQKVSWFARYSETVLPFLLYLSYLAATTYIVIKLAPNMRRVTQFLTILTGVLVIWNAALILQQRNQWNYEGVGEPLPSTAIRRSPNGGTPDIYLIVLDKYTGSRSLRNNYAYDNSDFESFLLERGFILPSRPQSNYIYTGLSLASLLNFKYLDDLPAEPSLQSRNKSYVNHIVEDNAVSRFLKARHYKFIFFPTGFPFTADNRFADVKVPDPRRITSEFEIAWRRTTLLEPVLTYVCLRLHCPEIITPFVHEASFLEQRFTDLQHVPSWERDDRPLFVFAHLTVPHEPYIFNADCTVRPAFWPSYYVVQDERPEKQAYTAQITCLNRRLKTIVGHLLSDSRSPPIILLQSDHGHGRIPLHIPDVHAVARDRVAERADIFAAYYLPGVEGKAVYDSISPVNVFRVVFREYFGADLPPLPDLTYWSAGTELFRFTRVQNGRPIPE